jgi:hypothetical protein
LGEFLNSKVGANTEVWHQGICHLIKNYMLCPRKKGGNYCRSRIKAEKNNNKRFRGHLRSKEKNAVKKVFLRSKFRVIKWGFWYA